LRHSVYASGRMNGVLRSNISLSYVLAVVNNFRNL